MCARYFVACCGSASALHQAVDISAKRGDHQEEEGPVKGRGRGGLGVHPPCNLLGHWHS